MVYLMHPSPSFAELKQLDGVLRHEVEVITRLKVSYNIIPIRIGDTG